MRGGQVGRVVWTAVLLVAVADVLIYLRRRSLLGPECCSLQPPPLRGALSALARLPSNTTDGTINFNCTPTVPCEYPEVVDFRIIVITCNRSVSLAKLLRSIDQVKMDGDIGIVEIWIDRTKAGKVNAETLRVANEFHWIGGATRVHVQERHAGIYGQWIHTWRPRKDSQEVALILEDDLSVSPYTYRWLKAAHAHYGGRPDIAGYTLQSELVNVAKGKKAALGTPRNQIAFLYKLMGSWGFSPHPRTWAQFQDWFQQVVADKSFHPYVADLTMTKWYQDFEKEGVEDSMWTMWFIYFCDKHGLFTVYNNIAKVGHEPRSYLAQHRREPGLHYHGKTGISAGYLLKAWRDKYIRFPKDTIKYDFDGSRVR